MKKELCTAYLAIMCEEGLPAFIEKYLQVEEMRRLKDVSQFCGCDYAIYHPRFFYSRYDHSLVTALMTWHFTKDKTQTLCALFHDLGTPCFSHCIDYLLGDHIKQESAEKEVFTIIVSSKTIRNYLKEDNIALESLKEPERYSIVENKKPHLCVDRLDGVLHTVYIWLQTRELSQIKKVYNDLSVLTNEAGQLEIGFQHQALAEAFFEMVYEYSVELQSNEDKFVTQFTADCLHALIESNLLTLDELYQEKEQNIVRRCRQFIPSWQVFEQCKGVSRSTQKIDGYCIHFDTKKRYVLPLCLKNGKVYRLDEISTKSRQLLQTYYQYQDSPYAYVPDIDKIEVKQLTIKRKNRH